MLLWKDFTNKMKNKRAAKGKITKDSKELLKDELIVQRMSSDISGKAQKYSRIGPQEIVPFYLYEELTLQGIIDACQKHFAKRIEKGMVCDVLAGEIKACPAESWNISLIKNCFTCAS